MFIHIIAPKEDGLEEQEPVPVRHFVADPIMCKSHQVGGFQEWSTHPYPMHEKLWLPLEPPALPDWVRNWVRTLHDR